MSADVYLQSDQPEGVPPLALTGERTLPDVPEENYWYQRHLVVYEWIAKQTTGRDVIDMACGEGYGSAVLKAGGATTVVGVDANPEAHAHAKAKYAGDGITFERALIDGFERPCDAVVFLQTIEHVEDPGAVLEHFKGQLRGNRSRPPVVYVSTPNLLTIAPKGAEKSDNPWHVKEYRAEEFAGLLHAHFETVELHGLFHARMLRVHALATRLGWDWIHPRAGLTKLFYDRFTPAIGTSDFSLRQGPPAKLQGALDFVAVCRA